MKGDLTTFWFLRLLLFAILMTCGFCISTSKKKSFTPYLWAAIIAYALIEGLRWMRGTDYETYLYFFKTGICPKDELFFLCLVKLVSFYKIEPSLVFIFGSGLFIGGIGIIFKNLRFAALWGLPLIYLLHGYNAENLVRQYMAISFFGFAYYFYYIEKYKWMLLCLFIAPLIHISSLIGVLFFLLIIWKQIKLVNFWAYVAIYIAAFFLWNPEWLSNIAFLIGSLNLDNSENLSTYFYKADIWFTQEGSLSAKYGLVIHRSLINRVLYFLTDIAIIIVGYFACLKNQKLVLIYYFSFGGIVAQVIFGDIQVLMRFGYYFSWMLPILIALVIKFNDYGKYHYMRLLVLFLLFAKYGFYLLINCIGKMPMEEGCMFIWDK